MQKVDHPSLMRDADPASLALLRVISPLLHFRTHLAFLKTIRVHQMAIKTEKTLRPLKISSLSNHKQSFAYLC